MELELELKTKHAQDFVAQVIIVLREAPASSRWRVLLAVLGRLLVYLMRRAVARVIVDITAHLQAQMKKQYHVAVRECIALKSLHYQCV